MEEEEEEEEQEEEEEGGATSMTTPSPTQEASRSGAAATRSETTLTTESDGVGIASLTSHGMQLRKCVSHRLDNSSPAVAADSVSCPLISHTTYL